MDKDNFRIKRRQALGLIATSATVLPVQAVLGTSDSPKPSPLPNLKDPDLKKPAYPWSLALSENELRTLSALCDMIIPADAESPSASTLGVPQYINEHVSAPYAQHKADLIEIRGGLVWLDGESQRRFSQVFTSLNQSQKMDICDVLCMPRADQPQHAASFFSKVRNMTAAGYFTTRQGMAWVGYIGNSPSLEFPPPPAPTLKKLGLESVNKRFARKP